jgi:anthranilate synthase component 2
MVFVVDNYDSFTYNLVQYLGELGAEVRVGRSAEVTVEKIAAQKPRHIVISPGPGRPENAGISMDVVHRLGRRIPIFGVCLGHQAIGAVYGGTVVPAPVLMHGKVSMVSHDGRGVFRGLNERLEVGRYHSLILKHPIPKDLEVTAQTDDNVIMGLRHRRHPVHGVQFHPESVLTVTGKAILRNFLDL